MKKLGSPSPNLDRIRLALTGRVDSRRWVGVGTVGILDEKTGEFRVSDYVEPETGPKVPLATHVDERGLVVDVKLEPSEEVITARYAGVSVGQYGAALVPLRLGDEVLVLFPDGEVKSPAATVVAVLSNEAAKIPTDWNNDRVLFNFRVPLEIRGPAVSIRSSNLTLNGRRVSNSQEGI